MSPDVIGIIAALALVALSLVVNGILTSRTMTKAFEAQTANQKWIWSRFLALLEPHIVEQIQEVEAIDAEIAAHDADSLAHDEPELIKY